MTPLHRIYFDTNDGTMADGYPLVCKGAQDDIQPIADKLTEGMHVVIYMTGELEMEAVLELDPTHGYWVGRPIKGTLKILDHSAACSAESSRHRTSPAAILVSDKTACAFATTSAAECVPAAR